MNEMNSIQTKLDTARAELLDQSLRNPLINYRLSRARGVEIVDESPPDVYRILVPEGKTMSFLPKLEPEEDDHLQLFEDDEVETDPARHTDSKLQTDYSSAELQRRLRKTHDVAKIAIEEQGVNTLYLALGMLQWYESESSDILRCAPLILIPVEIDRASVRARFRIRYTGEDIGTNLSLQEKLKSEFDLQLPDLPDAEDLDQSNIRNYYQTVDEAINGHERWWIDGAAIALGFFSFAKFLMYRDLDAANWPGNSLSEHSVLQSVLTKGFQEPESTIDSDTSNIDEHLNPTEAYHVVDADSSQALAIHDVSQGRNLIIQGPPGTGKSQTITNLIAEAIAKEKRVLFVAEKMAALEVVKRNLDEVRLGDACLELHSHKMNKKAVVDELKRILELGEPRTTALGAEVRSLLSNRDRLNSYCQAVNTPIGESGITPYQAYGELLIVKRRLSAVTLPALGSHQFHHSVSEFGEGLGHTEELQRHLKRMGVPVNHPFWGSQCKYFPPNRAQVEQVMAKTREGIIALKDSSEELAQHLKLRSPDTHETVGSVISAARRALDAPNLTDTDIQSTEWRRQADRLNSGLHAGEQLSQLYKEYENLLNRYDGDLIDETWFKTVLEIRQALELLTHSSTQLAQHLKLQSPDSLEAVRSMISAVRYLLYAPKMEHVDVKTTEWLTHIGDLEVGLRAGEQLYQLHKTYDDVLIPEAWTEDVLEIRRVLVVYGPKWWRFLSGKYRRARNELAGLCAQPLSKSLETQLRIVDVIRKAQREQLHFETIRTLGQRLFGPYWRAESSNWTQLHTITEYLSRLYQLIERNDLPEELIDYLASNPNLEILRRQVSTIEEYLNRYQIAVQPLEQEIQLPKSLEIQARVVNTILEVKRIVDAIVGMRLNLEGIQELGKQLFGIHWQEDASNWSQLQTIAEYLLVLHQALDMTKLPKKLMDYLASNPDFERLQAIISPLRAQRRSVNWFVEIKRTVDAILEAQQELEKFDAFGKQLFGTHWQGEFSNWSQLQKIAEYLSALHESVEKSELPEALVTYLAANPDLETLQTLVSTVERHQNNHPHLLQIVVEKIQLDEIVRFGCSDGLKACSFTEQAQILERWERELDRLQDMITYNHLVEALKNNGLAEIVRIANSWSEASEFLSDLLKQVWYSARVETVMQERPILASFSGDAHQYIVERFKEQDYVSLEYNKARVAYEHRKHLPRYEVSSGQLGLLRREFEKKRRHLPIRQLIDRAGNAIQAIKPIFMMSPLSVATFLPPSSVDFDWVVFDEASQVKPVDAFGAIIRGRQTVVVGDNRQLPPTRFFDKHIAADDDDEDVEENLAGDMESILGLFSAQNAPECMLRWHYRSRHESLITVSNVEFYDNKLQLFPSPDAAKEEVGLVYHYLPDTAYDRGGSGRNKEEARTVAEKVMEHARRRPDLTLGVATFSTAQMEAVQDELEILRREDPSYEQTFFSAHPEEPFFVKNLENVQGDERDVIFIGIGYGPDANGHLTMNFGPLNQDGGERRLNVLITRARRRCEVFTNLNGDDIDLSRTNARGVAALKRYLKYAETGKLDIPKPTNREADSPFEIEVANALRRLGYQVEHQIGSAGYFIDLGVKDSERPGRYLLGIECDGATYHSAQSARDRDRLRQQVLEGLGWRIHRIWSTDWFRNPDREVGRVAEAIEAARVHIAPVPEVPSESNLPDSNEGEEESEAYSSVTGHLVPEPQADSLTERYALAELFISTGGLNLHEVPSFTMANWIQGVVKVESPVHLDEVARRIATAVGVGRVGNRIQDRVKTAARQAARSGNIQVKRQFLYWTEQREIAVRDRSELPNASRKIELIAPEEVEVAIKQVVSDAYGIEREELVREVCRLFGFRSVSGDMRQGVERVIEGLIENEQLIWQGDSLVIP